MNLNFSNLIKTINIEKSGQNITKNFIKELEEGFGIMRDKQIKEYTIDRFEGNIAVLEDRQTKEMIDIEKKKIPKEAKEGSILTYKEGKFNLNKNKEKEIEERIQSKMNDLWNN